MVIYGDTSTLVQYDTDIAGTDKYISSADMANGYASTAITSYDTIINWKIPKKWNTDSTIYKINYEILNDNYEILNDNYEIRNNDYNITISSGSVVSIATASIELQGFSFRQNWQDRLKSVNVSRANDLLAANKDEAEQRARELLKELIGPQRFKKYLKTGFIMVKGKSGLMYRIRGDHHMVRSFVVDVDGKYHHLEDLCVIFKEHGLPYTDYVIMRLMLIENDEFAFRAKANIFHNKRKVQVA